MPDTIEPSPARFYEGAVYSPDESIGYLMKRVLNSVLGEADRRLATHDITHSQWMPLYKLAVGCCDTVAALSRDLQIDPGAMTRSLDRLEAKGMVRRVRSTEDRRVVKLELTDEGQAMASQIPALLADVLNAHLAGFDHDEWQQLLAMLKRLIANGERLKQQSETKNNA